ncbi:hypothetical protein CSOJ01_03828 [Colletotrichum sojae]|uniref:T6SS Phospholipase effector Tle1-like catalytic domain-containing protein n=1 Tax=Colletotrichum sojae TaxID=2175907 RepID=A0A8H6MZJ9_9PEZI|nr:hypothetical protein CSOJ01_03828 [Colletotrichum sojae]
MEDSLMDESNFVECAHLTRHDEEHSTDRKRLVICCDGTWNNSTTGGVPTNVSRLSAAVAHKCCTGMPQVVYYHRGAGTEESRAASFLGGLFGLGVRQDIVDCYRFICDNYNPGDEIIIVGFSRGAFTARSISSMVCSLGFLNRAGLDYLGAIYRDYQSFNEWTSERVYDPKKHLLGFTVDQLEKKIKREFMDKMEKIENRIERETGHSEELHQQTGREFAKLYAEYERRLTPEGLEKQLDRDKRDLFRRMSLMRKDNGRIKFTKMANAYRGQLSEYGMCLTRRSKMDAQTTFEAVEGRVKAVGVWDTVGSLGIPKLPWCFWQSTRSASELQFASLDVHPNIDHAFHALALDEWRTAFAPTLWNVGKNNTNTQLRQVWFPGCHSNVGGGSDTQQISKIALAWMADQLTSVGVEFSKKEMRRIFQSEPQPEARPWGLGKITSPESFTTTFPDRAWNAVTLPYRTLTHQWTESSIRKPGLYSNDSGRKQLKNTKELVHPSVRVRFLYNGLGLDDSGEWQCKALAGHKWELMFEKNPPKEDDIRPGRDPRIVDQYKTVGGTVTAVHEQYPSDASFEGRLVKTEHPKECDLKALDPPMNTWTWRRRLGDRQLLLPEEHIGVWERMYIEINDDMVRWQDMTAGEKKKRWSRGDEIRDLATEAVSFAFDTVDRVVKTAVGMVFGAPPAKYLPKGYPREHGYHDFVSWQRGLDATSKTSKRHSAVGYDSYDGYDGDSGDHSHDKGSWN